MNKAIALVTILLAGLFSQATFAGEAKDQINGVIEAQAEAWNNGDIPTFMEGYWKSDQLRFASGGDVTYGWQDTLDRYLAGYPDLETMGILKFSKIDIRVVSDDFAVAFGRWGIKRNNRISIGGLFTLLFEKHEEGWRIVADHTSADDFPVAVVVSE